MSFWCPQFLPKNEQKQVNLRFHSNKVDFVRLLLARNIGLKKSFQVCLTFNLDQEITPILLENAGVQIFVRYRSKKLK